MDGCADCAVIESAVFCDGENIWPAIPVLENEGIYNVRCPRCMVKDSNQMALEETLEEIAIVEEKGWDWYMGEDD